MLTVECCSVVGRAWLLLGDVLEEGCDKVRSKRIIKGRPSGPALPMRVCHYLVAKLIYWQSVGGIP